MARTQVVDPNRSSTEAVRFGAHVVFTSGDGSEQQCQIVGVDETEPEAGRVAFTPPIARAVTGKRVGDVRS
ncbi:MAG: GreA/GreB family elongation factor [Bacteroidota bacterium]